MRPKENGRMQSCWWQRNFKSQSQCLWNKSVLLRKHLWMALMIIQSDTMYLFVYNFFYPHCDRQRCLIYFLVLYIIMSRYISRLTVSPFCWVDGELLRAPEHLGRAGLYRNTPLHLLWRHFKMTARNFQW